jgi:hypothetical protein
MKENKSLMEAYLKRYVEPDHGRTLGIDTLLRECIGKTDDIDVPLCSHKAIINRELGEGFCRICQKDLRVIGEGRWNDYLILRHPKCQQPICFDCAENNPDEFHKSFREGLEEYKRLDPMIRANIVIV